MNDQNLLTVQEAAARLQVPVSWIYERTRLNRMPGMVRMGKYVRISEAALVEFIKGGGELGDSADVSTVENACGSDSSWTRVRPTRNTTKSKVMDR